jgi:hypothetical protein
MAFPTINRIGAFTTEIRDQINSQFATLQGAGFVGSTTQPLSSDGNLNVQISAAGIAPGATAADNVLAVFSIPAGAFSAAGKMATITAVGVFGGTANNKRVKIIFNPATAVVGSTVGSGGTTVADTGTVATNGLGWTLSAQVTKYGAPGSNTQLGVDTLNQAGAVIVTNIAPAAITAVESGAILVAVTGNATTVVGDILLNSLQVRFSN